MGGINIVDLSRDAGNTDVADRLGALTTPAAGSVNAQLSAIQGYVDTLEALVGALTTPDAASLNGQIATLRSIIGALTTPDAASVNGQLATLRSHVDTVEAIIGPLTTPNANSINGQLALIRGYVDNLEAITSDTSSAVIPPTSVNVTTTAAATLAAAAAGGVRWRRINLFVNSVSGAALNIAIGANASATVRTVQVPTNTLITLKTLVGVTGFAITSAVPVDVTIET
jgi:hypothetical protein